MMNQQRAHPVRQVDAWSSLRTYQQFIAASTQQNGLRQSSFIDVDVPELQRHRLFQAQARANVEPRVAPAAGQLRDAQTSPFEHAEAQAKAAAPVYEVAEAAQASISSMMERPFQCPDFMKTTPQADAARTLKPKQSAPSPAQPAVSSATPLKAAESAQAAAAAGAAAAACAVQPVIDTVSSKQNSSGPSQFFGMPVTGQRDTRGDLYNCSRPRRAGKATGPGSY